MKRRLAAILLAVLTCGPVAAQSPTLDESVNFMLRDRTRLDGIQMRVRAKRSMLEWVRQETLKLSTAKHDQEKERLREAYDAVVKEMRSQSRDRHRELIADLERHVLKYSGTQASGDIYLRLAELYFDDANYDFIEAMEEYENQIEAYDEGKIDVFPEIPEPDYTRAIELYREFIGAYPNHRYITEALYLYAFTLEETGNEPEAVEIYEELLKQDDRGPLAPEVAFRIGEYYFLTGDLDLAAKYYRHALRLQDETFYDKALYKLAWTYYRMSDFERALLGFVELVDYTAKTRNSATEMRTESMQYIAIIFSERGGQQKMLEFFDKIGGRPYLNEVIAKLGEIYFETADYANALAVFNELNRRLPLVRTAPEISRQIEECWVKLEKTSEIVEERLRFAENYGPGSKWQAEWQPKDDLYALEVSRESEKKRFDYAAYFHAEGQKAKSVSGRNELYAKALKAYQDFESQFPNSLKIGEVVFNQAEIEYETGNWVSAGRLYKRVPEIALNPVSDLFSESAWNMILSYRKALADYEKTPEGAGHLRALEAERRELEKEAEEAQQQGQVENVTAATGGAEGAQADAGSDAANRKERAGGDPAEEPAEKPVAKPAVADKTDKPKIKRTLPREAIDLLKASIYYVKLYPLGDKSPLVYYNTGDIFFRYGMYSRARDQYQSFVERFPNHEFLMDGIRQITRTYLLDEKFGDLVSWGYGILDSPLANREEVREYFTTILSGAIFKDAQQLEAAGKLEAAAEKYLQMIDRFPDSEFVDEALINAGVSYQKQGNWDKSTQIFLQFYGQYPEHPFAPQALFQTAWNAERVIDFDAAVSRYTELLDVFPEIKETKDALFNSATILAKLGKSRRAAELYLLYVERFPDEDDEAENLYFAGKAYYDDGDFETARTIFDRFLKHEDRDERVVEIHYLYAKIAEGKADQETYWQEIDKVIEVHNLWTEQGEVVDPRYVSEAAFRLAERKDSAYQAIRLRLPMQVMASLLEKKATELKVVTDTYLNVIKFKDPYWSAAALHMIGEAYQHFANSLFDAPVPPELDEEEAEFYVMELEDQAFPIEDKAMQSWKRNLDLAVKVGADNEWVRKSRDRLLELFPDVARIKEEERRDQATNEFFYSFKSSSEQDDEIRIDGAKVTYVKTPYRIENLEERYQLASTWTQRHRQVVLGVRLPAPELVYSGDVVNIEGIKELWNRSFRN